MKAFLLGILGLIRLTRATAGEKINWRAFMLYASLTILAPAGSGAESLARLPDTIKGYGGYQFGMSLEEAKRVDARAKVTNCDYKDIAFCLERADNFLGEPGMIRILFSAKDMRLSRINLTFDRLAGTDRACKRGSATVEQALLRGFGPSNKTQDGKVFWYAPAGGAVSFLSLCVDDDTGMIVVSYEPTTGF
jgi:hypothetical protein